MIKKRIGLVGFHSKTGDFFRSAGLNVPTHIFANPDNKKASSDLAAGQLNFHFWKRYHLPCETAPGSASFHKQELRSICFTDFIRCTDRWDWSRELVNDWSDYEHLFSLAFDHAWEWLTTHDLDAVVYSNVPHQGMAVVQYHLARLLKIETRIFIQSQFADRSWLVDHWHDLGRFSSALRGHPFKIDIAPPLEAPFYMNSTRSNFAKKLNVQGHKFRAGTIVSLGLTGLTREARRRGFQRNMTRWQRAVQDEHYIRNASEFFVDQPQDEEYVYFPLHLQPEMTTDILGGIYADQASALEKLRKIVPEEMPIYVKENPKQSGRLRGQAFFDRVSRIPNIRFLSTGHSSLGLSNKATAVATISGTAGWEALRMGKPTIAFGNAFWNHLPGAYRINNDPKWQDIRNFSFDKKLFKKKVDEISRYAHPGICDPAYSVLKENFDHKANSRTLLDSLILRSGL